jgi:hypothetical protein
MLNLMNSIDRLGQGLRLLQLKVKSKQQNFFSNSEMVPVRVVWSIFFHPQLSNFTARRKELVNSSLQGCSAVMLWTI